MLEKEHCMKAIKAFRAKHGLDAPDENVIAALHLMNAHGMDVHAALDQSSRSGNDQGIDAWFFKDTSKELFIYQSKLTESKARALKGLDDLGRGRTWLENVIVRGSVQSVPSDNHCLFNLYTAAASVGSQLRKIHFVLLSLFDENELEDSREYRDFESQAVRSSLNELIRVQGGKVCLRISEYNLEQGIPERVKVYPIEKIPNARIELRKNAHLDLAYVTLHSLVELYRQRGDVLFDKNVRLSLIGNKDARDRLVHPMDETLDLITSGKMSPSIFAFYHIGVTVAAAASAPEENNLLNLEAPNVINGCQTIVIVNEYLNSLEKQKNSVGIERFKQIKVICKVVVGMTGDEVKEITNSNNRQNPIENWQLFSNEPVHVEIEAALKDRGIFYERQKGKFDSVMKKADHAKYYHFTNGTYVRVVDLAQIIALARGYLHWAAKPSEIFLNKDNHDKIFDKSIPRYPDDMVFTTNLFKALKRGLNNYLQIPTHTNGTAPLIFKKPAIRAQVYRLAMLHFYQSDGKRSAREDYSTSLTKIASQRLVDDTQAFYQRLVTKIKNWYTEESKDLTVEISSKKTDPFFTMLASELGVETVDCTTPFSPSSREWQPALRR